MNEVFLSYAREDSKKAEFIAQRLTNVGINVWWESDIPVGESFDSVIETALEKAKAVIVLWSKTSINSEWVRVEADFASRRGKLLPVLIEPCDIPFAFRRLQHFDLTNWRVDTSDFDIRFSKFLTEVKDFLNFIERPLSTTETDAVETLKIGETLEFDKNQNYKQLPRAKSTKIFLAHASVDKPKLKHVVTELIDQGFQIWIDKPHDIGLDKKHEAKIAESRIVFGHDWKESIRKAIKAADSVLAFWSKDAVYGRREQFHYEIYLGLMGRKLNQCRIEEIDLSEIGMPYTFDHIADLKEINPEEYNPELDYLMQDIVKNNKGKKWWSLMK
jgi:hypothetical protein